MIVLPAQTGVTCTTRAQIIAKIGMIQFQGVSRRVN